MVSQEAERKLWSSRTLRGNQTLCIYVFVVCFLPYPTQYNRKVTKCKTSGWKHKNSQGETWTECSMDNREQMQNNRWSNKDKGTTHRLNTQRSEVQVVRSTQLKYTEHWQEGEHRKTRQELKNKTGTTDRPWYQGGEHVLCVVGGVLHSFIPPSDHTKTPLTDDHTVWAIMKSSEMIWFDLLLFQLHPNKFSICLCLQHLCLQISMEGYL